MTVTIVSSFINVLHPERRDKNIESYFQNGLLLLNSNIQKIIFVDNTMYEKIKDYQNHNTKIILVDKKKYYLFSYLNTECLANFFLNTDNPSKDTIEYMFTMCLKTEFMREAVEINHFNSDHFIWVDFGIRHVFNCDDTAFTNTLETLTQKFHDKIRIASIWNLQHTTNKNIYQEILWYFAGGVFGGSKEKILIFADLMKEKCLQIIYEKQTLMWEVNIWYLIYLENKELFDCYYCDHNNTIIANY
jgi:hypothetical protein